MSKHKKQVKANPKPQRTPEAKEKARQRQARYRAKPEVRQKQLALMAERRLAGVNGIHPVKTPLDVPSPSLSPSLSPQYPALDDNAEPDDHTLTPAEDFALCVLMDMAAARNGHARPAPAADTLSDVSDGYCKCSLYSRSPSPDSSMQAVAEHPVVIKPSDVGLYHKDRFPPYVSLPTSLQKKTRREIRYFGPITGIQHVQFLVSVLHGPIDEDDEDQTLAEQPVVHPCLSVEHQGRIRLWRRHHAEYDTAWDEEARWDVAEKTLQHALLSNPTREHL
ncbi:hypothetical protein B0H14DRAFT_2598988 [Mycena olivaceomarginata]|nr:hypothetical protein B0H14DRAFT_2598988 [Mycena olivaceomarginata]